MSDLFALFDAVRSNLDDPLARGVLADWLDDLGDVRGDLVRASEGVIAAHAEWDALSRPPYGDGEPAPEFEDESDDPHGWIANRNRRRQSEYQERARARYQALVSQRYECNEAYDRAAERLTACYDAWFRRTPPDLGAWGFDFETFCGFVDTLHARVSLLRRVHPRTAFAHPIRTLYAAVGPDDDDRTAPATYVPLPHLDALVIAHGGRSAWPLVSPTSVDLDYLLGSPWLARARTLVLGAGRGHSHRGLLAWAGTAIPAVRAARFPVVRVAEEYRVSSPDEIAAFCESSLVGTADELDLGVLLDALPREEFDAVLRLPFPGVRVLRVGFLFHTDGWGEAGYATEAEGREAALLRGRERLAGAAARWAGQGRELHGRLVPHPPAVHPVERVLRAYWSANDPGWVAPRLQGTDSRDYDSDWNWPEFGPYDSDEECGVTPTRRELYRGRFRNPKR